MKRSPLVFVALAPFVAAAAGGGKAVNHEELKDDWRVSEILGSEVHSKDGQQYGQVEDVVLTNDGRIESVLITAEDLGFERDQATFTGEAGQSGTGATGSRTGETATAGTAGDTGTGTGATATERGDATLTAGTERDPAASAGTTGTAGTTGDITAETGTTAETGMAGTETGTTGETGTAGTTAETGMAGTRTAESGATEGEGQEGGGGLFGTQDDSQSLVAVQWQNPSFNQDENVIELDVQPEQVQAQQTASQSGAASGAAGGTSGGAEMTRTAGTGTAGQGHRVSEIMDMDVQLSDEESFGSVDDILVNQEGEASALIVSSWDFLDRQQYALPVEPQNINVEEGVIRYEMSSQEVQQQGEFQMDESNQESGQQGT